MATRTTAVAIALAAASMTFAARAEVDLAGERSIRVHEDQPERGPGPEIGDFTGLPINAAARQRGMGWDASLLTVPEHQCGAHPANHGAMHSNIRIWKEVEPQSQQVVAKGEPRCSSNDWSRQRLLRARFVRSRGWLPVRRR